MHGVHHWEGQHLAAFPSICSTFVTETKINVSLLYFFNKKLKGIFIGEDYNYLLALPILFQATNRLTLSL